MAPTKVGVIGAGIAGPALAILLKSQGYDPTIYERTDTLEEAGLGIGYVVQASVPSE